MLIWDMLATNDRLVAAAPWISAPAKGFLQLPRRRELKPSIMKLIATWDTTIPPSGGPSDAGWVFESSDAVVAEEVDGTWKVCEVCLGLGRSLCTGAGREGYS